MKLITAKAVLEHEPCPEWTEERLRKKLGKEGYDSITFSELLERLGLFTRLTEDAIEIKDTRLLGGLCYQESANVSTA